MKKKVLILTVSIILILSMSIAMMAGCKDKEIDFGPQTIGTSAPANPQHSISADMTAFQMLEAGMKNYYDADVAVSSYFGSVKTKVLGIEVGQDVWSTKIRVGKGDADGNNANGASYFADNKGDGAAKLYEKIVITPDKVVYKTAGEGISHKTKNGADTWSVKKWKEEESFDDVLAMEKAKNNNPTKLWMYDLRSEYVQDSSKPSLSGGVYSFSITFDPEKSTASYIDTMKAQLEGNAGMPVEGLEFEKLTFKVEMWENGAIKRLYITESYHMKLVLKFLGNAKLDSSITLNSDTQFAYEEVEGLKLADHVAQY